MKSYESLGLGYLRKGNRVVVFLSDAEKEALVAAAKKMRTSYSDVLRLCALDALKKHGFLKKEVTK